MSDGRNNDEDPDEFQRLLRLAKKHLQDGDHEFANLVLRKALMLMLFKDVAFSDTQPSPLLDLVEAEDQQP